MYDFTPVFCNTCVDKGVDELDATELHKLVYSEYVHKQLYKNVMHLSTHDEDFQGQNSRIGIAN